MSFLQPYFISQQTIYFFLKYFSTMENQRISLFKILITMYVILSLVTDVHGNLLDYIIGRTKDDIHNQEIGRTFSSMFGDMSEIFGDDLDGQILQYVYRY